MGCLQLKTIISIMRMRSVPLCLPHGENEERNCKTTQYHHYFYTPSGAASSQGVSVLAARQSVSSVVGFVHRV